MAELDPKAYLAAIVESSDDAIISKDLNGIIQSFNGAAERMFGYRADEIVGRSILTLIPVERHGEETEVLARLRRGQRIDHFETVRVTKTGQFIDVSLTVSPVRDDSGTIVGASKIARDITEQKRNREVARTHAEERERLLEAERAARSEAERANRVKDDFVAMMSHELRTPLNAILGWTELLRMHSHDAKMLETGLEIIARNTRHQADLISDLLDVSRIVSGKLRLDLEQADLGELVAKSVEALLPVADEKGVTLVDRREGKSPSIVADPQRLQQIVLNLISNAVKFTPAGGLVTVGLEVVNDRAVITVTDTGIGFPPDAAPRLFDKFGQGSAATTRRHGGLGLGLYITRDLTELHGGTVRAWSAGEGKGATFTVELPLVRASRRDAGYGGSAADAAAGGRGSLSTMKVLLVEDDLDTLELVRRLLEMHDAEVIVATSGPEALRLAATVQPNILVSDIGLPDIDGYELVARLRQIPGPMSHIPAVALTAYARQQDRARALRAGFNAHVAKPVEPAELIATVGSFANLVTLNRHR
jgi:PAS domain S-box-containing protein